MKKKSTARAILSQYHALKERRYLGDMDACDTLIDFERAVSLAKLTRRQAEAISLVYGEDLTQKDAGERMGIDISRVSHYVSEASEAIDGVYEYWAWHSGELEQDDFIDELEAV